MRCMNRPFCSNFESDFSFSPQIKPCFACFIKFSLVFVKDLLVQALFVPLIDSTPELNVEIPYPNNLKQLNLFWANSQLAPLSLYNRHWLKKAATMTKVVQAVAYWIFFRSPWTDHLTAKLLLVFGSACLKTSSQTEPGHVIGVFCWSHLTLDSCNFRPCQSDCWCRWKTPFSNRSQFDSDLQYKNKSWYRCSSLFLGAFTYL